MRAHQRDARARSRRRFSCCRPVERNVEHCAGHGEASHCRHRMAAWPLLALVAAIGLRLLLAAAPRPVDPLNAAISKFLFKHESICRCRLSSPSSSSSSSSLLLLLSNRQRVVSWLRVSLAGGDQFSDERWLPALDLCELDCDLFGEQSPLSCRRAMASLLAETCQTTRPDLAVMRSQRCVARKWRRWRRSVSTIGRRRSLVPRMCTERLRDSLHSLVRIDASSSSRRAPTPTIQRRGTSNDRRAPPPPPPPPPSPTTSVAHAMRRFGFSSGAPTSVGGSLAPRQQHSSFVQLPISTTEDSAERISSNALNWPSIEKLFDQPSRATSPPTRVNNRGGGNKNDELPPSPAFVLPSSSALDADDASSSLAMENEIFDTTDNPFLNMIAQPVAIDAPPSHAPSPPTLASKRRSETSTGVATMSEGKWPPKFCLVYARKSTPSQKVLKRRFRVYTRKSANARKRRFAFLQTSPYLGRRSPKNSRLRIVA